MTTHELAKILLEMPEKPAMTFDDEGYHELGTIIPAIIYRTDSYGMRFNVPVTVEQKKRAFEVLLVT